MQSRSSLTAPMSRRQATGALVTTALLPLALSTRAAALAPDDAAGHIAKLVGGAPVTQGRVTVTIPKLAENGNLVSLTLSVDSPMTSADHVTSIHVFAERNPIAPVANVYLGPRAGRAYVQTNIRLASSQTVTAIAKMSDGRFWSGTADVIVTMAACVDPG